MSSEFPDRMVCEECSKNKKHDSCTKCGYEFCVHRHKDPHLYPVDQNVSCPKCGGKELR